MAKMTFSGTEEVQNALFKESERLERKAAEMLGDAGQVVVKSWRDTIESHGHVKSGAMRDSVKASTPKKKGEAYESSVYPTGKDAQGVRNAEKAFILHYGTSKIKGDFFVDDAEEAAADAAEQAMQDAWERD